MFSSLIKRLSSSLTRGSEEEGNMDTQEPSSSEKVSLSKKPTLILDDEPSPSTSKKQSGRRLPSVQKKSSKTISGKMTTRLSKTNISGRPPLRAESNSSGDISGQMTTRSSTKSQTKGNQSKKLLLKSSSRSDGGDKLMTRRMSTRPKSNESPLISKPSTSSQKCPDENKSSSASNSTSIKDTKARTNVPDKPISKNSKPPSMKSKEKRISSQMTVTMVTRTSSRKMVGGDNLSKRPSKRKITSADDENNEDIDPKDVQLLKRPRKRRASEDDEKEGGQNYIDGSNTGEEEGDDLGDGDNVSAISEEENGMDEKEGEENEEKEENGMDKEGDGMDDKDGEENEKKEEENGMDDKEGEGNENEEEEHCNEEDEDEILDEEETLWYCKGEFVTVQNDIDGFYVCQLQEDVYSTSTCTKIQWLTDEDEEGEYLEENNYLLDYFDTIHPHSILLNVNLSHGNEKILKMSKKDLEDTMEVLLFVIEEEEYPDQEWNILGVSILPTSKPVKKKRQLKGEKKKKKPAKERKRKEPKRKEPKRKKKEDPLLLHPNPNIKIQEEDPFFEAKCPVPFISKYAHARLVFRAINMKDHTLLKKMIKDRDKFRMLNNWRSVSDQTTALHHAMLLRDKEAVKMLNKAYGYSTTKLPPPDHIDVNKLKTGFYNQASLGIPSVRAIMASRGSREGNNALIKDVDDMVHTDSDIYDTSTLEWMFRNGLDMDSITQMFGEKEYDIYSQYLDGVRYMVHALERGHLRLVREYLQSLDDIDCYISRISRLHLAVLKSSELKTITKSLVTKGSKVADGMTPIHCAACNPDVEYLRRLLEVEPEYSISDKYGRKPIHFAAACEGTAPLEFLLQSIHDPNIYYLDRRGNIPLHFAVQAKRLKNIELLLEAAENADSYQDPHGGKYGKTGINMPNKKSRTPLHLAIETGDIDVVRLLVGNGADVNAKTNTAHFKVTPLMMAAQLGFLDMARFLVDKCAVVEQKDRLGRTAVIHAAMNGNTNVLSYLLNLGASPTRCDSSGNSPLHYAAAYGWYFCVKTLLEAGADVNISNDWKTTPLSMAYMKGHIGLVTVFLEESDVDVNFQDDEGRTLVSIAASSALIPDLYDQMLYLINDKGALCTYKDVNDQTPLHHLALNRIVFDGSAVVPSAPSEEMMEVSVKIARLLVEHECDVKALDLDGIPAAMTAFLRGNIQLYKFLVESGCPGLVESDSPHMTELHGLAHIHMDNLLDHVAILTYMMSEKPEVKGLRKMLEDKVRVATEEGVTPLEAACNTYINSTGKYLETTDEDDKQSLRLLWEQGRNLIQVLAELVISQPENEPIISRAALILSSVVHDVEYGGKKSETDPEYPALRMMLQYKPNMNTLDRYGNTPLTSAVRGQKLPLVKLLLEESNADVNSCSEDHNTKSKTPVIIHASFYPKSTECLTLLLEAGADVNAKDEKTGYTALHAVIEKFNVDDSGILVQKLLDAGVDVNAKTKLQRTPLHFAVDKNNGRMDANFDLIITLLANGACLTSADSDGRIPLHYVFTAMGSQKLNFYENTGDPLELCRVVTSKMSAEEINTVDKYGMSALHKAAFRGASVCCLCLIQKGANINLADKEGNTPLTLTLKKRQESCAALLIQNGADVKVPVVDPDNKFKAGYDDSHYVKRVPEKSLYWQVVTDNQDEEEEEIQTAERNKCSILEFSVKHNLQGICFIITEQPIEESGVSVRDAVAFAVKLGEYEIALRWLRTSTVTSLTEVDENGRNLLHILSFRESANDFNTKVLSEILKKGVSLTHLDNYGCSPLHYAALKRVHPLCMALIEYDDAFSPGVEDVFNRSVISAFFWKPINIYSLTLFKSFLQKLITRGGTLDVLVDRPIHSNIIGSQPLQKETNYFKLHDIPRVSPLIISIANKDKASVEILLKEGASLNFPDSEGRTPLMHAVVMNDLDLVKCLMTFTDGSSGDVQMSTMQKTMSAKPQKGKKQNVFKLKRGDSARLSSDKEDSDMEVDDKDKENNQKGGFTDKYGYKPIENESNVNLNAVDKNGWTVIHHAVCPLSFGTFDNDEMVSILAKAGAKLTVKNKKGETPLDLAIRNGAFRIARMIQELENVPERKMREPTYKKIEVSDEMDWKTPPPSFNEDAENFKASLKETEKEYIPQINNNCDVANGSLVKDEDQHLLYDVLLTKVDVNQGMYGLYNFYQMQFVHQAGKDLYILFTRWGRIGDRGQFQHTPFKVMAEGVKEFCKVFREKTGNIWTEVKSFQKKPGKYRLVESKERRIPTPQENFEFSESPAKSELPVSLQKLMLLLTNKTTLNSVLKSETIDSNVMSFGHLDQKVLMRAKSILEELRPVVQEAESLFSKHPDITSAPKEDKERYQVLCDQVGVQSSEYFQVIPQKGFEFEKIRPLITMGHIHHQLNLIEKLMEYEFTSRILCGAKYREKEINPLDYVYRSVECRIQLMEEDDEESQYILFM